MFASQAVGFANIPKMSHLKSEKSTCFYSFVSKKIISRYNVIKTHLSTQADQKDAKSVSSLYQSFHTGLLQNIVFLLVNVTLKA